MREINKIAEGLFEKIRDRFEDVSLGDDKAKACSDPEKARFFNFDYTVDGDNHGNITMSLIDETSLKIYFSKNISDDLDKEQKKEWYSFLRELREFARRNLLSFEPRDITRSTLKHRDIQQQSKADSTYDKDEVVAESKLYGTSKSSYQKFGPARIIVRHDKHVTDESQGERSRHINSVYVENDQGERFKMPFKSLTASRAMARHISAGGTPHDDLGQHICEMAQECSKLKPFLNNVRHRMFEDEETKTMVEAAFDYHKLLKNTLQRLGGKKGYTTCKEQFVATSTSYVPEDDVDLNEIKERFIKRVFNDKMTDALPLVHKAYNMKKENKFTEQFETWATAISEGTWALPETDEDKDKLIDILSQELPVGVDAQNATNVLYNIFGDDRLFDALEELSTVDPEADARDTIMDHLMDKNPTMYQAILDAIGDEDTPEPAEPGDEQEVAESKETRQALSDQDFEFPQQGQYGYRQGYKGSGVLELADGRTGKIINLGEFGDFDDEYKPNQKWLRIVFTNPNMDDNAWAELEDMLWSDQELTESPAVKYLSDATAKAIIDDGDLIYNILSGRTKVQPGEAKLLQSMYDDISIDKGYAPDDDFEEIEQTMYDYISHDYSHVAEGNTYGSGDGGMDGQVTEDDDKDPKEQSRESAQAAIIRRIMNSHTDALLHYGPGLIVDAVEQYAYNLDDLEEIGTSDVSIWTEHVLEILSDMDMQKQDDREEYQQHHAGNDTENDPQVRNTEFEESKDKITYDPKTGKLSGWEHEGDWKKQTKNKDPVGKIHHMSDVARKRTEKMAKDETLEEAFERLVNEADSKFMSFLEPLVGQEVYIPGEGTTGTVVGPSPNSKLPTGIQVKLSNGQLVTTGPGLFKSTKPGLVQQAIDKFNSLTGKIDPVPSVAKPYGTVAGPMDNLHKQDWSSVKEDILKLAGMK